MHRKHARLGWLGLLAGALVFFSRGPVDAYVDVGPATLGGLCNASTFITLVKVEKFSEEKRIIIYRKVADLKGQYPRDQIRHILGATHGTKPEVLQRAQVGKTAIRLSSGAVQTQELTVGTEPLRTTLIVK